MSHRHTWISLRDEAPQGICVRGVENPQGVEPDGFGMGFPDRQFYLNERNLGFRCYFDQNEKYHNYCSYWIDSDLFRMYRQSGEKGDRIGSSNSGSNDQ